MTEFPIPAYELAETRKYFLGSIQYSSGCPYQCEFCDIPGLYGRNPRLKTPQQIIAELDKLRECGMTDTVYFVDDNFIGNRKAALDLLPHLIEWQKRTGYVTRLACEATLNIAKRPEILEKMREAFFVTDLLRHRDPRSGRAEGDAQGPQHDGPDPGRHPAPSIPTAWRSSPASSWGSIPTSRRPRTRCSPSSMQSRIPLLTINLLQALPKTPLWDRLETRRPPDRRRQAAIPTSISCCPTTRWSAPGAAAMEVAYQPEKLFARYQYQCDYTYANRLKVPVSPETKSWANIRRGLIMLRNIFWKVGVLGDYRKVFWKFALGRLRARRHRGPDRVGHDRASSDQVRARGLGRPAERIELFDPAARGLGSCRVSDR